MLYYHKGLFFTIIFLAEADGQRGSRINLTGDRLHKAGGLLTFRFFLPACCRPFTGPDGFGRRPQEW